MIYLVNLPWKIEKHELSSNYDVAKRRFEKLSQAKELSQAESYWICKTQIKHFPDEFTCLTNGQEVNVQLKLILSFLGSGQYNESWKTTNVQLKF